MSQTGGVGEVHQHHLAAEIGEFERRRIEPVAEAGEVGRGGLNDGRPLGQAQVGRVDLALETTGTPSVLALSRQNLPHQARDAVQVAAIARGGYVLAEAEASAGEGSAPVGGMDLLRRLVRDGARWRYGGPPPDDVERQLARELISRESLPSEQAPVVDLIDLTEGLGDDSSPAAAPAAGDGRGEQR